MFSTVTGKALDCQIMSKECAECKLRRGKEGTEEFGSNISTDAMLAIFQRSVEQHNIRYVEFLGDGDSKAHNL